MASCDLFVELDRSEAVYRPNETITGTVIASVSRPVKCDALDVSVDWYTHGKGNRRRGMIQYARLFSGELPAGEHSYRFELTAPTELRAYHGEILNVDFEVRATADIPWAFDPQGTEEIVVLHDADADYVVAPQASESGNTAGCFPIAAIGALAGAASLALAFATNDEVCGQIGLALLVVAAIGGLASIAKWMAQRKTGAVSVKLLQGGGGGYREVTDTRRLRCEVHLERRGARVNEVSAKLVVRERVIKGSGTNKKTFEHPLYDDRALLEPSEEQLFLGYLRLPPRGTAPFPFTAPDNNIDWFVEVHVDIAGWPDWKGVFNLGVSPSSGGGAALGDQALPSS